MGAQFAALPLAGRGAAWSARTIASALQPAILRRGGSVCNLVSRNRCAQVAIALTAAIVVLAPAWLQLGSYDRRNSAAIAAQRRADITHGAQIDRLIAVIKAAGSLSAGARAKSATPMLRLLLTGADR